MSPLDPIAVLFQATPPPLIGGVRKPMKESGYADSGADIVLALQQLGHPVILPVSSPSPTKDRDWVFPDTEEGISAAIQAGAKIFWLNTVLYQGHPIERFADQTLEIVGQIPAAVGRFDDKYYTNQLLRAAGLPIPPQWRFQQDTRLSLPTDISFPLVLKPIRGRGSQGISVVQTAAELPSHLQRLFASGRFGTMAYGEPFLPGKEITMTVLPPGTYLIGGKRQDKSEHWCLPAVKRFNHEKGIAPYSGKVAVMENSAVMEERALQSKAIQQVYAHCVAAAALIGAKAAIRMDGRADAGGNYYLFDLNLKPNMTGPSRKHRQGQDSLTALAARKIGWNYTDLIANLLQQKWSISLLR